MRYFITPLSKESVQILRDCWLIETSGMVNMLHILEDDYAALEPLYDRALIDLELQVIEGREMICISVTASGIDFIKSMDIDEQKARLLKP